MPRRRVYNFHMLWIRLPRHPGSINLPLAHYLRVLIFFLELEHITYFYYLNKPRTSLWCPKMCAVVEKKPTLPFQGYTNKRL